MIENEVQLIIEYCELSDREPKHRDWCELETGLWNDCDCGYYERRAQIRKILGIE